MSDDNDDFESLFGEDLGISAAVGDGEIFLRKQMGNDRFDALMAVQEKNTANAILIDEAHIRRINNISDTWKTVETAIKAATLLTAAWSVYFWVFGRFSK